MADIIINDYHFSVKNNGGCILYKASYNSGEDLDYNKIIIDEKGKEKEEYIRTYSFDRTATDAVIHEEIVLPDGFSEKLYNRQYLWNKVENAEKFNGYRAKDFDAHFPNSCSKEECINIAKNYIKENFTNKGYIVDFGIHWNTEIKKEKKDKKTGKVIYDEEVNTPKTYIAQNENHHIQFLVPIKNIDKDGNVAEYKSKKVYIEEYEYEKDENGNEIKEDKYRIQQVHPITKEPLVKITYDEKGNRIEEPEYRVPQKDPQNPNEYLWTDMKEPVFDENGVIQFDKNGKIKYKKVPELDKNGNEKVDKEGNTIYKKVPEFRIPLIDEKTGLQKVDDRKRKQWKTTKICFNELNEKSFLYSLRRSWAEECNKYLQKELKITEKSYYTRITGMQYNVESKKEEKIELKEYEKLPEGLEPKKYVSRIVKENELRGDMTNEATKENIEIKEHNSFIIKLFKQIEELKNKVAETVVEVIEKAKEKVDLEEKYKNILANVVLKGFENDNENKENIEKDKDEVSKNASNIEQKQQEKSEKISQEVEKPKAITLQDIKNMDLEDVDKRIKLLLENFFVNKFFKSDLEKIARMKPTDIHKKYDLDVLIDKMIEAQINLKSAQINENSKPTYRNDNTRQR